MSTDANATELAARGLPTENVEFWLAFLTWDQLTEAISASHDEYENRFAKFVAVAQTAADAAHNSSPMLAELRAEMDGCWAACKAQDVMTHALTDERAARRDRGDYA